MSCLGVARGLIPGISPKKGFDTLHVALEYERSSFQINFAACYGDTAMKESTDIVLRGPRRATRGRPGGLAIWERPRFIRFPADLTVWRVKGASKK
jgi:hypothetical protein